MTSSAAGKAKRSPGNPHTVQPFTSITRFATHQKQTKPCQSQFYSDFAQKTSAL